MKTKAFTAGFLAAAAAVGLAAWYLRWSYRQFDNQGG